MKGKCPYILDETMKYLEKNIREDSGLTEQIFAPSPLSDETKEFIDRFSEHCLVGTPSPFEDNPPPEVVAPIILYYLQELKEPLIPKKYLVIISSLKDIKTPEGQKKAFRYPTP